MEALFPPTPPDRSPVGPGQQRNTSSAATYRSSGVGGGRNGGGRGYYAAEDEVLKGAGANTNVCIGRSGKVVSFKSVLMLNLILIFFSTLGGWNT